MFGIYNERLSPASRARNIFFQPHLGLTPQALRSRPLRGLYSKR